LDYTIETADAVKNNNVSVAAHKKLIEQRLNICDLIMFVGNKFTYGIFTA
jgi:hypothetical protein